jgi:hypothetical protein
VVAFSLLHSWSNTREQRPQSPVTRGPSDVLDANNGQSWAIDGTVIVAGGKRCVCVGGASRNSPGTWGPSSTARLHAAHSAPTGPSDKTNCSAKAHMWLAGCALHVRKGQGHTPSLNPKTVNMWHRGAGQGKASTPQSTQGHSGAANKSP